MLVLAIDTALEACSAAVFDSESDALLAKETHVMVRGHAEAFMPMLARVMDRGATGFAKLDRIAVTVGPGSFTGLRVGIAAARGIGLAAGKVVVGVTTLAALAAPFLQADRSKPVAAAIDGRHQNVYFELFTAEGGAAFRSRMIPVAEAAQAAAAEDALLVGSGARLIADIWPDEIRPQIVDARAPEIDWVARLGAAATAESAPAKPLYLRAPDAQPHRSAILPRK